MLAAPAVEQKDPPVNPVAARLVVFASYAVEQPEVLNVLAAAANEDSLVVLVVGSAFVGFGHPLVGSS